MSRVLGAEALLQVGKQAAFGTERPGHSRPGGCDSVRGVIAKKIKMRSVSHPSRLNATAIVFCWRRTSFRQPSLRRAGPWS